MRSTDSQKATRRSRLDRHFCATNWRKKLTAVTFLRCCNHWSFARRLLTKGAQVYILVFEPFLPKANKLGQKVYRGHHTLAALRDCVAVLDRHAAHRRCQTTGGDPEERWTAIPIAFPSSLEGSPDCGRDSARRGDADGLAHPVVGSSASKDEHQDGPSCFTFNRDSQRGPGVALPVRRARPDPPAERRVVHHDSAGTCGPASRSVPLR